MTARAVAGAVLTGGASRRMGRTKALVEIDGVPMARRVADALRDAGCDPVELIGGDPSELAPVGLPVVADERRGVGPLGGVATALGRFADDAEFVAVVSCDVPDLTVEVVTALIDAAAAADAPQPVAVARTDRLEPACAVWSVRTRPVVLDALDRGERAVHRVLAGMDVIEVAVSRSALRNVNTPADLADGPAVTDV